MILTGGFMIVEAVGGILSGSLTLLADAGHMLTDTAALALAWFAFRIGNRPADPKRSFGYHRFQILAAFANGLTLFAIAGWIIIEAIRRLLDPSEIHGISMIAVAAIGLLVNIIGFWIMSRGEKENLNIRSAALHVMGDLLGSVAAIVAAAIILLTGWLPIDPILSVLVALLIVRSAWAIIKQSSHILLQGTPEGLDPVRIGAALGDIEGVSDVHDVHAWSLTNERPVVTLHTVLDETADYNSTLQKINNVLKEKFGIEHATIQLERKKRTH
ncbi:MAG: cation transporter [Micavibrio sp.]|nr:cation transporter [Micavibrio sp.]